MVIKLLGISMDRVEKIRKKEGWLVSMDRSAQNCDRSSECEIRNLRRIKFLFDVAPLEIIDNKEELLFEEEEEEEDEEDFIHGRGAAVVGMNINQINLVIDAVNYGFISQYWSLKSNQQQLQLNSSSSSSSSCHYQHGHRDHHHHLRDDDDDEEMIMITCRPSGPPKTVDRIILLDRASVFAADDDYIMSQLRDLDLLYELEWILKQEQLEEVKKCIVQRISEAKPALLLLLAAKQPNNTAAAAALRIRVDLSRIFKRYYANPAAAASAYAEQELYNITTVEEDFAIHYPAPTFFDYDDAIKLSQAIALKSSKEALETKILEKEDLISSSSSSSSSCSVCLNEFCVGVDEIKKMPCSHMFHLNCLNNWLWKSNTCPLCRHELPTFWSRFLEDQLP